MWQNREVWLLLALPALVQAQNQGQNTTSNNGGGSSVPSGSSSGSIIGFAVVVSFLLVALCVVILLCFKFGTLKCLWSSTRMRSRPIFPRSSTLRDIQTETQVVAQAETQPQSQQLQGERITSTNLNPIHDTVNRMEQLQPRVLTLAQFSQIVSHSANTSIPNSPNPQGQNTRGHSAQATTSSRPRVSPLSRPRVPPLQIRPVDPPPPYPAMGYPYQPCKSPPKATSTPYRAQATTPITPISCGAEINTPVTPAPYGYGVQQLHTAAPVTASEESLSSEQLQLSTPPPYSGTCTEV